MSFEKLLGNFKVSAVGLNYTYSNSNISPKSNSSASSSPGHSGSILSMNSTLFEISIYSSFTSKGFVCWPSRGSNAMYAGYMSLNGVPSI